MSFLSFMRAPKPRKGWEDLKNSGIKKKDVGENEITTDFEELRKLRGMKEESRIWKIVKVIFVMIALMAITIFLILVFGEWLPE